MNVKCFLCLLIVISVSCKKEDDSELLPKFEGITVRFNGYDPPYQTDPDDWRLDVEFSQTERYLFDTLNFDNVALLKSMCFINNESIKMPTPSPEPVFYPNPIRYYGCFYHNAGEIANIVVVDKLFNKLIETRDSRNHLRFDFSSYPEDNYRVYYVFQDSAYQITGMGYGDVMVGLFEYE